MQERIDLGLDLSPMVTVLGVGFVILVNAEMRRCLDRVQLEVIKLASKGHL